MLVRRAVMRGVGGYPYQMGRGVVRLVPGEVMQGVAGYVRQVGTSVLTLVRCAVTQYVGGYLYQIGRGVLRLVPREVMQGMAGYVRQVGTSVLTLVRRAVAFLQFEDGWDAAGYICLSFGLALMLLGTLAAPDLPALSLLADEYATALAPGPCDTNYCTKTACFPNAQPPDCVAPYLACRENLGPCLGCKCVEDQSGAFCACYASPPAATE